MIKKIIALTISALIITSCTSDDSSSNSVSTVNASINFSPYMDGQLYSLSDTVKNSAGFATRFDEFKYYVSNVKLFNTNGDSTVLDAPYLIDYTNPGSEIINFKTESGSYKKIKFSIGLSEDLNQTDPTTVPYEHPLSNKGGMFWTWGSQYRFITLQGFYSQLPDLNLSETFAWHPGKAPLYREVELDLEQLHIYENTNIQVELNVSSILTKYEDVDIPNEPNWHGSPSTISIAHKIVNNFVGSLSIKK